MQDSIFTKIIKREIPCHAVYEDDKTLAFMDINPVRQGQVLVVPKAQVDHFMDLPEADYRALMDVVKQVAQRLRQVFPDKRVGVIIEGFEVPHAHVKLLPISSGDELRAMPSEDGQPDHPKLAEIAKQLAF